jgi:hypothetical protein
VSEFKIDQETHDLIFQVAMVISGFEFHDEVITYVDVENLKKSFEKWAKKHPDYFPHGIPQ